MTVHGVYVPYNFVYRCSSMSSTTGADDAEDVNDFLQRIRDLGNKRDQEDEERNRKLEEEILQGRKERQARRAGWSTLVMFFARNLPHRDVTLLHMNCLC